MFAVPITLNMAISIPTHATVELTSKPEIVVTSIDRSVTVEFASIHEMTHDHELGLLTRIAAHYLAATPLGVRIETFSEAPSGAGIAGSSALNIATCAAFTRARGNNASFDETIINVAKDVEAAHLHIPTGLQDYAAALYGGVNAFSFPTGGMVRQPLHEANQWLEERVLLFYSGQTRNSGINNWEMFKAILDKDPKTMSLFHTIAAAANKAAMALDFQDELTFCDAVNEEWEARAALFPGISTPVIDAAIVAAKAAGAKAARICGAGGGGCFIVLVDPADYAVVKTAVTDTGATFLDFHVARRGVSAHVD
jgi:D-glycero-alpha-D-manno-heptose-7-phosphate kinase